MEKKTITVTSPLLPSLEELMPYLQDIWNRKWLTNNGHYHQELEKALCEYLKVPYISLFTNGTLPLMCALQALRITGEVITTPYSFVATTHALWWNGIKSGNLQPRPGQDRGRHHPQDHGHYARARLWQALRHGTHPGDS